MNAALCVKPNKEGDAPCPPLNPLLGWGGKLEDRLITTVDPTLPVINIEEWMPKPKDVAAAIPKAPVVASADDAVNVEKLLSIISADCSYERWFKVLCTISSILGKDREGVYELADDWSATGKTYDARAFGKTWSSIKDKGTLSIATLHYFAKEENATRYGELFPRGSRKGNKVDIYKSRNYDDIKATFEETVFKVIKPVTFYQKKSDASGYFITMEDKIKAAYRNVIYNRMVVRIKTLTDGTTQLEEVPQPTSFINDWLCDTTMRAYDRAEFDPSCTAGEDVFNTFTGFAAERIAAVDDDEVEELVKPFVEHMKMLIGEDGAKFVLMWLANMFQNPTNKASVAIVLHSSRVWMPMTSTIMRALSSRRTTTTPFPSAQATAALWCLIATMRTWGTRPTLSSYLTRWRSRQWRVRCTNISRGWT